MTTLLTVIFVLVCIAAIACLLRLLDWLLTPFQDGEDWE